mmetsp:Transcript_19827/g.30132  ORF Transcript_19827/g.30132 Transcript_19827/m.30132 type:complete len:106 (-) Transcript_19827:238-555(-)
MERPECGAQRHINALSNGTDMETLKEEEHERSIWWDKNKTTNRAFGDKTINKQVNMTSSERNLTMDQPNSIPQSILQHHSDGPMPRRGFAEVARLHHLDPRKARE